MVDSASTTTAVSCFLHITRVFGKLVGERLEIANFWKSLVEYYLPLAVSAARDSVDGPRRTYSHQIAHPVSKS